jgi:hypothetical protein
MDLKKIILNTGKYLGQTFYYGAYLCIGMGFIWLFFIAPAVMMSAKFGWGWGVAWLFVLPLLAYFGRNLWLPARWV